MCFYFYLKKTEVKSLKKLGWLSNFQRVSHNVHPAFGALSLGLLKELLLTHSSRAAGFNNNTLDLPNNILEDILMNTLVNLWTLYVLGMCL